MNKLKNQIFELNKYLENTEEIYNENKWLRKNNKKLQKELDYWLQKEDNLHFDVNGKSSVVGETKPRKDEREVPLVARRKDVEAGPVKRIKDEDAPLMTSR
jgi:hypothetical protein